MDQNKIWGATGFNFEPTVISSTHQWHTQGHRTQGYSLLISVYYLQAHTDLNIVFGQLNKWFKANLLSLNFDKTYFIQIIYKSMCTSVTQIM